MSDLRASDGTRLYLEESGTGEPILFAHEFGGDWRSWQPQVDRFSEGYRCIRYCARGFLPSDVPAAAARYGQERSTRDLLEIADGLSLARFHLVGLSMGSFTALSFALAQPERLRSLTLAGCSSGPCGAEERVRYRAGLSEEIALLDSRGAEGAVQWFAQDPAYRRMPGKRPAAWQSYCDNLRNQSVEGARHTLASLHWNRACLCERRSDLRGLRVPTLLVVGEEDHPRVRATSAFLASVLPAAAEAQLPRTGHLVNAEDPEIFNDLLATHLARVA